MNPLALIPGFSFLRLGIVAVILVVLAGAAWKFRHGGVVDGRAEVQQGWDADKAAVAETTRILLMANAKTSGILQKNADQERRTLNERLASIDLELDESLRRLRARPSRPPEGGGGMPTTAGLGSDPVVCNGAGLYEQDAGFLTREAARANVIRARLEACETRYKDAQSAVNK